MLDSVPKLPWVVTVYFVYSRRRYIVRRILYMRHAAFKKEAALNSAICFGFRLAIKYNIIANSTIHTSLFGLNNMLVQDI